MATNAQFAATPIVEVTQIPNTANTARDGSGTITQVCAGPTGPVGAGVGKRITRTVVHGISTTTAGMIRFFVNDFPAANKRLYLEKPVTAVTPSGTVSAFRMEVPELAGLILQGTSGNTGNNLYASTNAGETFNIFVESGLL